jgi:hypothetical protein
LYDIDALLVNALTIVLVCTMPTYYARGVTVRLGATSLADTVTPNITLKKGDIAKKQCEKPERRLLDSQLLHEEHVQFPGDDQGFELNWVGGAPFIQVQAGDNLFGEDNEVCIPYPANTVNPTRLRRTRITGNNNNLGTHPLALSLHVKTSDRTFVSGMDKHNKLHLKIEVFFNGQISSCLFLPPYEIRSNTKTHHQVFAGYRVDYLAERPWVILPPQTAANGSPRKSISSSSAEDRWKHIGRALGWEADERGTDSAGNVPPTSNFLKALSTMEMPDEIRSFQSPGSRNFGVVDVVITAGDGRKVTSGKGYLKTPQRFPDKNFPLRNAQNVSDETIATVEHNALSMSSPKVRQGVETSAVDFDIDANGESDSDHEPQPKRQTLARSPAVCRLGLKPSLPPQSRTGAEDTKSKAASTSFKATPKDLLPCTNTELSTSEHPNLRSEDFGSSSTSSPERGRTDFGEYTEQSGLPYSKNVPFGTPQSFYSFPSSSVGLTHTPQMRPSPYSLHTSDSFRGNDTPNGLISLPSIDYAGFLSSPLQRAPPNMSEPYLTFCAPPQASDDQHMLGDNGATVESMLLERIEQKDALDPDSMPARAPAAPDIWSQVRPESRLHESTHSPFHIPNMWPTSTYPVNFVGHRLDGLAYPSPYDRHLSMPLPPTGLFTVPTKPRLSLSPSKKPRPTNLRMPQGGFLLKRLIITGKDGATVVNREWAIAQYVAMTEDRSGKRDVDRSPPPSSVDRSLSLEAHHGRETIRLSDQKEGPQVKGSQGIDGTRAKLLPTGPSSQSRKSPYERPASAQRLLGKTSAPKVSSERSRPTSNTKVEGTMVVNMDRLTMDTSCVPSYDTKTNSCDPLGPLVPQRRTVSGTNTLGVQGPKAATFWLEDPEELLRGASKAQRSKSPIKCVQKRSATTKPMNSVASAKASDDTSSPLSSLATTPEPGFALDLDVTQPASNTTMIEVTNAVAQMDGLSEHKLAPASLANAASSPTKLALGSTPQFLHNVASAPKSAPSSNTKKRKAEVSRYLQKQPRSPDRLKTISNPPLNNDCVIAFAESEDKESERGVLRQIKSERQGVFAEEYVVFATRFFVAGN